MEEYIYTQNNDQKQCAARFDDEGRTQRLHQDESRTELDESD